MSSVDYQKLSEIFFPYCSKEENRVKNENIDFAYYCNLDTVFKILDNKELWLRNIRCMSDYKELLFGYTTLKVVLYDNKEMYNKFINVLSEIDETKRSAWIKLLDLIQNNKKSLVALGKYINIICFTEHDPELDKNGRLEMLNSYGRGNGGCVIFDARKLIDSYIPLSKVIYVKDAEDPVLTIAIGQIISSIKNNISYLKGIGHSLIKRFVIESILYAIISIKHNGFLYEKEWRLIKSSQAKMDGDEDSEYVSNCVPVCLNGIPQMVYKLSLVGKEDLLKGIIIEGKYEEFEECMCLSYLLESKWKVKEGMALKMIRSSEIPIKRQGHI